MGDRRKRQYMTFGCHWFSWTGRLNRPTKQSTMSHRYGWQFYVRVLDVWLCYEWRCERGLFLVGAHRQIGDVMHRRRLVFKWRWTMGLKRRTPAGSEAIPAELAAPIGLFAEYPAIAEFLAAVKYDDGTIRIPGSVRIENVRTCFRVTLYDPDAGLRLPFSGPTVESCCAELNRLLEVADAPWEVDQWLTKQAAQRPQKKKK